jgi:hypothetical protein
MPQSELVHGDELIVNPVTAILAASQAAVGPSIDGGLSLGGVSFTAIGVKADTHPAETAHLAIDVAYCGAKQITDGAAQALTLVAGAGCAQTSISHLDCVLQVDGSAHFAALSTPFADAGLTIPIRACSGLCVSDDDACAESHVTLQ